MSHFRPKAAKPDISMDEAIKSTLGACSSRLQQMTKSNEEPREECSVFGEWVAMKLKNMSPITRCKTMYAISTTLYNAEIAALEQQPTGQ